MGFQSVNEIETFDFQDCQIISFEIRENQIFLELEALIVKANNSQNTNYTESYAGTTKVKFENAKICSGVLEGYQYFDANDVLLEQIPDKPMSEENLASLPALCKNAYLYAAEKIKEADLLFHYCLRIESAENEEPDLKSDSYQIELSFEKAVFCWERYLNRVQK